MVAMQRRDFLRYACAGALVVATACARGKPDQLEPLRDPITVHVRNENFLDMNISVLANSTTRRLGQVTGNSSASFKIPWSVANGQQIVLVAVPIGGRGAFRSGGLSVGDEQMVEMRIGPTLAQSSAVVREPL
jgi:hypothetical protein